ncbi:MAG: quinone-dependent dihydroorotate dehydrogenase [Lysobacterales bacterium]
MYRLFRPLLFALDAERAHDAGLASIAAAHRCGLGRLLATPSPSLPVDVFGLGFANPVGLAAGLDKNGAHIDALAGLGFGFIEIGTTTPRPQSGNPRPRLFRLPAAQAVINRMGFNNAGVEVLVKNAERARFGGPLGINIGKNKDTPNADALADYGFCLERVYARADYVTINISSPNTAGLRELQDAPALRALLSGLLDARERLAGQHRKRVPLLLKIAPDLGEAELDAIAAIALELSIDGLIATNTTLARPRLAGLAHAGESGGLSGKPLFDAATAVLHGLSSRLAGRIPLVGVGGILCGADAAAKAAAGASLVQFYTGLIYRGPELIAEAVAALGQRCATKP